MKTWINRFAILAVSALLLTALYIAYSDDVIDIAEEMVPLTDEPAMFTAASMPTAPGTVVSKNPKAEIDISNKSDGYICVRYLKETTKSLKVLIKGASGVSYTYTLKQNGDYEVYPLSDGDGKYQVSICENISGTSYSLVHSASFDVKLTDEYAPFIRPNQFVNYKADSKTVKKAAELTKNCTSMVEKVSAVYNYVIKNITYDKQLAANVKSGYLPDIDAVLEKGKGICFDYAAVMTAMLRSQGVPAKLVVGYTGELYHAWINTYSEETGWVNSIIYFDGKEWILMDPTFASGSKNNSEIMKYIGEGKNYTSKYIY